MFDGYGEKVEEPGEARAALQRGLKAVAAGQVALIDIAWRKRRKPMRGRIGRIDLSHRGLKPVAQTDQEFVIPLENGIQVTGKESAGEFRKEKFLWQKRIF